MAEEKPTGAAIARLREFDRRMAESLPVLRDPASVFGAALRRGFWELPEAVQPTSEEVRLFILSAVERRLPAVRAELEKAATEEAQAVLKEFGKKL